MKNESKIMNFRKFISFFRIRESLKEVEMDRILDKISKKVSITPKEKEFMDNYDSIKDDDMQDFLYLTKEIIADKIHELLSDNKIVICDLSDRDGKIGLRIKSISQPVLDTETTSLILTNNEKIQLYDRYLYNLIYDLKKGTYSLQSQDEFYEKIPVKNDER